MTTDEVIMFANYAISLALAVQAAHSFKTRRPIVGTLGAWVSVSCFVTATLYRAGVM